METGLVLNIQRYSIQDGPGIRTTVFLKGCPLDCWWCHNPESQSPRPQVVLSAQRCIHCDQCLSVCPEHSANHLDEVCRRCGACVDHCPTGARQLMGQPMTVAQVLAEILKDRIFHEDSAGGLTLSGGEPLMQPRFAIELLEACRSAGIHTALDTCGYAPQDSLLAAARAADLVLYDLKLIDEARHLQYTGVSNARILDNLRALAPLHPNIHIRIPLIPTVNDTEADLRKLAEFLATLPGLRKLSLLPYHNTGARKFAQLGRPYRLDDVRTPPPQRLEAIARELRAQGLDVQIGR